MKEQAIEKINKMGKAGVIITNIMKVFLILGLVCMLAGGIAVAILPNDLFQVGFSGDASVDVNMKAVERMAGVTLDAEELSNKISSDGNLSLDGKDYAMGNLSVDGDHLLFDASAEVPRSIGVGQIRSTVVCGFIMLAVILVAVFFGGSLCKAFRDCRSPFEENVIKKMRNLAYSLIPCVACDSLLAGIVNYSLGKADGVSLDLNIGTILIVLVVFALVFVFKYGAMLQQESDETL